MDRVLRPVEAVLSEPVCGLGPKGPGELEFEEPAGLIPQRRLPESDRRRHLACRLAHEAEELLYEVDVGDADAVEVPVVEDLEKGELFGPGNVAVARAEMAVAEFAPVEGGVPHVAPAVLHGVQEAADPPLPLVEKADVLAAVNDRVALRAVLEAFHGLGEARQVFGTADGGSEEPRAPSQPFRQGLAARVDVVVEPAAGAAGFRAVRLAEMDEGAVGPVMQRQGFLSHGRESGSGVHR